MTTPCQIDQRMFRVKTTSKAEARKQAERLAAQEHVGEGLGIEVRLAPEAVDGYWECVAVYWSVPLG